MAADRTGEGEDRPPLGSWPRLYAVVIGLLAVDIALLWLLSRAFP